MAELRKEREHNGLPLLSLTKLVVFEICGSAVNSWIGLGNNRLYWKVRLKEIIWQTRVIVVCQVQRNWSSGGAGGEGGEGGLIDIAALAAAIWNLYKLPYFSTLSLTGQRKKIRMDPRVNLFYTSKRDCMQKLVLVSALLGR